MKDLLIDLKDLKREIDSQSYRFSNTRTSSGFEPEAVPEKSVAVLYFENMNAEKESDYFCAGNLNFGFVAGVIPGSTTTLLLMGLPYSSGWTYLPSAEPVFGTTTWIRCAFA